MRKIYKLLQLHPNIILIAFFVLPPAFAAMMIAATADGRLLEDLTGWGEFYRAAGVENPFLSSASVLYLFFSPLALLYFGCVARLSAGVRAGQLLVLCVGCTALFALGLLILVSGPPLESLVTPAKGIRMLIAAGQYAPVFCFIYASMVLLTAFCLYAFVAILSTAYIRFSR